MGKQFDALEPAHIRFIETQPIFFSGSAARDGKINVSPKGMDSLRVLGPNRVIWRNLTGSGNETATHLQDHPRMTLMWCSFDTRPLILRTYGTARAVHRMDADWDELDGHFPENFAGRQIFDVSLQMVQSSCGYAVPRMELVAERDTLRTWAEDKGPEGVQKYWVDRNGTTLDGVDTKIAAKNLGRDV